MTKEETPGMKRAIAAAEAGMGANGLWLKAEVSRRAARAAVEAAAPILLQEFRSSRHENYDDLRERIKAEVLEGRRPDLDPIVEAVARYPWDTHIGTALPSWEHLNDQTREAALASVREIVERAAGLIEARVWSEALMAAAKLVVHFREGLVPFDPKGAQHIANSNRAYGADCAVDSIASAFKGRDHFYDVDMKEVGRIATEALDER